MKTIAASSFLTALECTKFVFGRGSYSAPPNPVAALRGPTCKGREDREGRGKVRGGKGRGRPLTQIPCPTLQRLVCTTPLRQFLLMCMQLVNCASTSQYM